MTLPYPPDPHPAYYVLFMLFVLKVWLLFGFAAILADVLLGNKRFRTPLGIYTLSALFLVMGCVCLYLDIL